MKALRSPRSSNRNAQNASSIPCAIDFILNYLSTKSLGLTNIVFAAGMRALLYQFHHGSLPDDPESLFEIMHLHGADADRNAQSVLRAFFYRQTSGCWQNRELAELRSQQKVAAENSAEYREFCSKRASHAGKTRWAGHVRKSPLKRWERERRNANSIPSSIPPRNASLGTSETPTLSPSQAQGIPPGTQAALELVPASHSPRRREPSASHGAQAKRAAKRKSAPRGVVAPPNGSSPHPSGAEAASPAKRSIPADQKRPAASTFTPQDPRFPEIANEIRSFWDGMNPGVPCPWGNPAKAATSRLLSGWACGLAEVQQCLRHRVVAVSAGELSPSQPPSEWIEALPGFLAGPVNKFGDPLRVKRQG